MQVVFEGWQVQCIVSELCCGLHQACIHGKGSIQLTRRRKERERPAILKWQYRAPCHLGAKTAKIARRVSQFWHYSRRPKISR